MATIAAPKYGNFPSVYEAEICFKSVSVIKNSVGSRTAAAGYMGATVVAHVVRSGQSRTDAVNCN